MQDHKIMKRKKTSGTDTEERILGAVIFALTFFIAVFPSLKAGINFHGDIAFHLGRIESLYRSLKAGVFPAKVHASLANSFGYGEGFFYPDALLYFPALLELAGLSLELSFKIFTVVFILLTWWNVFASVRRILRGRHVLVAVCGAGIYVLSFRFMHSVYDYGSIGTWMAMAFIPMAVSGLLMILFREDYRLRDMVWMSAGVCLVGLSHSTTAIVTIVFMLALFLCAIPQLRKKQIRSLCVCAVCAVLAITGYWLPALEQVCDQKFYLQTNPVFLLTDNILGPADLFSFSGVAELSMVLVTTIWLVLTLRMKTKEQKEDRRMRNVTGAVSLVYTVLIFFSPLWKTIGKYIQFLQSPTRLMATALTGLCFSFCLSAAALLDLDDRKWKRMAAAAVCGMLVLFAGQARSQIPPYANLVPADSIDYTGTIMGLGAGTEWLPDGGSQYMIEEPERAIDPEDGGAYGIKEKDGTYFDVYVRMDMAYYDMPYFYYKGYTAYLLDDNGTPVQELTVEKSPVHGYVRVLLPETGSEIGHVLVTYRKTKIQKAAYIFNGLFVIGLAVFLMKKKKSNGLRQPAQG